MAHAEKKNDSQCPDIIFAVRSCVESVTARVEGPEEHMSHVAELHSSPLSEVDGLHAQLAMKMKSYLVEEGDALEDLKSNRDELVLTYLSVFVLARLI